MMKMSIEGLAEVAGHEGIVLSPYRDSVGVLTWGIGHTAAAGSPDPADLSPGLEQPLAYVLRVFADDMAKYEARVRAAVTVPLEQHEFDALVSFDFNTGKIHSATLTKKLNAGDRAGAIAEFDRWHIPPEITARRDKEKKLFATGVYSNGGKANIAPVDARLRPLYHKGRSVDVLALLAAPAELVEPPRPAPAPLPHPRPPEPLRGQPDDPGPGSVPPPSATAADAATRLALPAGGVAVAYGIGDWIWDAFGWIGLGVTIAGLVAAIIVFRRPLGRFVRWIFSKRGA